MDKLIFSISPAINERVGSLLLELKDRNGSYYNLCNDIKEQRNNLKDTLDNATWLSVKSLVRLLMKKDEVDNLYLYGRGIKDAVLLSNYTDSEIIEQDFMLNDVDDDF